MDKRKWANRKIQITALLLVLLAAFLLAGAAWAGYSADYALDWHVVSGGGGPVESASGVVVMNGSLGQSVIGLSYAGQTNLGSGFWYSMSMGDQLPYLKTYLPFVLRNH